MRLLVLYTPRPSSINREPCFWPRILSFMLTTFYFLFIYSLPSRYPPLSPWVLPPSPSLKATLQPLLAPSVPSLLIPPSPSPPTTRQLLVSQTTNLIASQPTLLDFVSSRSGWFNFIGARSFRCCFCSLAAQSQWQLNSPQMS